MTAETYESPVPLWETEPDYDLIDRVDIKEEVTLDLHGYRDYIGTHVARAALRVGVDRDDIVFVGNELLENAEALLAQFDVDDGAPAEQTSAPADRHATGIILGATEETVVVGIADSQHGFDANPDRPTTNDPEPEPSTVVQLRPSGEQQDEALPGMTPTGRGLPATLALASEAGFTVTDTGKITWAVFRRAA